MSYPLETCSCDKRSRQSCSASTDRPLLVPRNWTLWLLKSPTPIADRPSSSMAGTNGSFRITNPLFRYNHLINLQNTIPMSNGQEIRVLVVDDDDNERVMLARIIASLGFTVKTARDGQEAMEAQAASSADVIVTDLMMPRMDGFGLLRALQEMGDSTPTIVQTAFGNIEKAIAIVHDLKAFWFLEKPVQPSILRALVERAATQKRLITETSLLQRQLSNKGVLGDLVGGVPSHAAVVFVDRPKWHPHRPQF